MIKLAVDVGSSVTKIYRADGGYGLVLTEPSCVAVRGFDREVVAVGKEAKKLVGKTAEFTQIVFPVYEGEIVDERLTGEMLKTFLSRVGATGGKLKRTDLILSVPVGADEEVKRVYRTILEECGIRSYTLVEIPFLSALGSNALLSEESPVFAMDIGGGMANMAIVSLYGVITGVSMNIGGNNIDADIIEKLKAEKEIEVGILTAERIKNEVGSLGKYARAQTVAEGSSVSLKRPVAVSVQSSDIRDCIAVYIDKIVEYAGMLLKNLTPEVCAVVGQNGLYLSGGLSKLNGVAEYIGQSLGMKVHLAEEPSFTVVSGAGALFGERELMKKICLKDED